MNTLLTKNGFFATAFAMVVLFGTLFFATSPASAQFLSGRGARIFLSLSPEHPQPGENVRITADSSLIDLSRSDIEWSVDDEIITRSSGQKEASITAGPLGSEARVSVVARSLDGTLASGEAFIRPAEIDILWESSSYVPPFYRGRALPSAGTFVRAHAIVRFKPERETQISGSDIIFTWKRNGSVVQSASGRGRSSALLSAPTLFGVDTIEVNAVTIDGALEGQESVRIPSIEPVLTLYKDHPLFGIMYHQALTDTTFVPDIEMAFAAVPYFAEAKSPDDPRLIYSWRINGNDVAADESKRSSLTINADKSAGVAQIGISLKHATNWFMQSSGAWEITFGSPIK